MTVPRIRSYTLNCWVGGPGWNSPDTGRGVRGWRVMRRLDDFVDPGPARILVFLDEREESMNDGYFPLDMAGYPAAPDVPADGSRHVIVDYPADWHDGGAAAGCCAGRRRGAGGRRQAPHRRFRRKNAAWLGDSGARRGESPERSDQPAGSATLPTRNCAP